MNLFPFQAYSLFRSPTPYIEDLKNFLCSTDFEDLKPFDFLETFNDLTTDLQRVELVYDLLDPEDFLEDKFIEDTKSNFAARSHRKKAEKAFAKENYIEALSHYTRCVMTALSSKMLAKTYSGRSAVLFKLGMFDECLEDIDRAAALGFSPEALNHLKEEALIASCISRQPPAYEPPPTIDPDHRHPFIPSASKSIEVRFDAKNRRRVFAAEDIQIGDVIAVEEPIQFFAMAADIYHCHHCFKLCYNPIPCKSCTQTVFCCEKCRDDAASSYHGYECLLLLSLNSISGGNRVYQLAFKTVMYMKKERNLLLAEETMSLIRNVSKKEALDDMLTAAVVVALIVYWMKQNGSFFSDEVEKNFKTIFFTVIRICMTHISVISELFPTPEADSNSSKYQVETVACGLFPFSSILSHSCAPNVFMHHHGTTRVLRAMRTIRKGEECFISYGINYLGRYEADRKKLIKEVFHFDCKCRACLEKWEQKETVCRHDDFHHSYWLELSEGDVKEAKSCVDFFISQVKQYEDTEPNFNCEVATTALSYCYRLLGNKRQINYHTVDTH